METVLDLPKIQSPNTTRKITTATIKKFAELALDEETVMTVSPVSWKTYDDFVDETMDKMSNPRFFYQNQLLYIVPNSPEHEFYERIITILIDNLAEFFKTDSLCFGSTTYRREDIENGFEPDSCFYFEQNAKQMRGVKKLEMSVHLAPDLIVEIDTTSSSVMRESIFAAFGVPEIWRFDGEKIEILELRGGVYEARANSAALPLVTAQKLTEFVQTSENPSRLEWLETVREWAREAKS